MLDIRFSTLRPGDLKAIALQPSQRLALGMMGEITDEIAELVAEQRVAWTVRAADGRILCCFGIVETFAELQGWGWAMLAEGLGAAHLQLTRFIQGQVVACNLPRLELLARCATVAAHLDAGSALRVALRHATPEVRWATLLGLEPVHVLRNYGAASESYVLFERLQAIASEREAA